MWVMKSWPVSLHWPTVSQYWIQHAVKVDKAPADNFMFEQYQDIVSCYRGSGVMAHCIELARSNSVLVVLLKSLVFWLL
jgi:hypothetical protein